MDQLIKNSIDARKNAFTNSFDITSETLKKKIDDLFVKINKLGEESKDLMDFESKFASSPLNGEYTNLFSELASNGMPLSFQGEVSPAVKDDKEYLVEEVASDAKYIADDLTRPIRRKMRDEFDSKMRDTPLGKIEQIDNMRYVARRLFRKNK